MFVYFYFHIFHNVVPSEVKELRLCFDNYLGQNENNAVVRFCHL